MCVCACASLAHLARGLSGQRGRGVAGGFMALCKAQTLSSCLGLGNGPPASPGFKPSPGTAVLCWARANQRDLSIQVAQGLGCNVNVLIVD